MSSNAIEVRARAVGQDVKRLREKHELTLCKLAAMTGIAKSQISNFEQGRGFLSEGRLADVLAAIQGADREWKITVDDCMERAGRLGDEASEYLKSHPVAIAIVRALASGNFSNEALVSVFDYVVDELVEPEEANHGSEEEREEAEA